MITKPSILYVEDDSSLAQLVKRRISKIGYQVSIAEDAKSAIHKIHQQQYDLLIIDYQLPELNGIQLLEQLGSTNNLTPAIMVSGQDDIRIAVQALSLGCMDYLIKDGLSYLDLLPVHIKSVLERRQLVLQKQIAEEENAKAQASLARAQHLARIGNWEWYQGDKTAWWSDEEFDIFGLRQHEYPAGVPYVIYKNCIHPDDVEMVEAMEERAKSDGAVEFDYRIKLPGDKLRWVHAINNAGLNDQGDVQRFYGTTQDITERKESEYQLMLAQRVFESTTEAIMLADANQHIISVNPAFTRITGYERDEVIGKSTDILKSGKHDEGFYEKMWDKLLKKGYWAGEIWNRNKEGEIHPEWLSINVIFNHHGEVDQYVSIFSDITQHKKSEQIIKYQANYDALTDLPNRHLFNDRLLNAIKLAERKSNKIALLFLDLDRFKWINDTLGHRAGDQLLQETAKRLSSVIRDSDSVARLGGDEFTLILSNLVHGIDAEIIAEKILSQLSLPYMLDDSEVFISASIGITVYPDDGDEIEILYRNADTAMYAAKEAGRNRFSFFTAEMQYEAENRLKLLNELQSAINNQEFELYYQPIINVETNILYGAEALLRWHHPTHGFIPPESFIPLAEETGLIQLLGDWVLRTAITQLKTWQSNGHNLHISVNKSSKQFHSDECAEDLNKLIRELDVDPSKLTIEITESVLMEQRQLLSTLLCGYRKLGIKISLDDFGTGYSSLSYLRQFPFDILKIDRSFIQEIMKKNDNATLVETIILMGHKLGLEMVAEGVETQQQREFLIKSDCDFIQGFLCSPAIPADEFERQFL